MFERKQQMIDRADAFVILPGGLGTLDELLEVVTLRQLGYHAKPIVVVNLDGFWDPLVALVDRVIEQSFAEPGAARASTAWSPRSRRCCRRSASSRPAAPAACGARLAETRLSRCRRRRSGWAPPRPRTLAACACCCRRRYSATKSIGSSISGGKPPSRVASAMIRRANGNSRRGHSISSSACRLSGGMFARARTRRRSPARA